MRSLRNIRVSFPPLFRRTPVANSLPVTQAPIPPMTVPNLGFEAGGNNPSAPASLRVIGRDSGSYGRSYIGILDDLNSGPVPDYIDHPARAKNAGAIGPGMASYPYDANREFMPHQDIPRNPGNVTPYTKTIDTGVTIPSVGIGAPV